MYSNLCIFPEYLVQDMNYDRDTEENRTMCVCNGSIDGANKLFITRIVAKQRIAALGNSARQFN